MRRKIRVKKYTRKNGTVVRTHTRSIKLKSSAGQHAQIVMISRLQEDLDTINLKMQNPNLSPSERARLQAELDLIYKYIRQTRSLNKHDYHRSADELRRQTATQELVANLAEQASISERHGLYFAASKADRKAYIGNSVMMRARADEILRTGRPLSWDQIDKDREKYLKRHPGRTRALKELKSVQNQMQTATGFEKERLQKRWLF